MKKERKVWAMTLIAFWWLSPDQTNAQQDSITSQTLREVVVTATRVEQPVIETPRSVHVINRDVIEQSVYNSIGELLSNQAGIYIIGSNQTPGTNQSLFLRGANSNQVVVMIDGMRINDPTSPNAAIDLAELSPTDVERIEIIRGSHSTLYGGSAIGGVVNIITRRSQKPGFHGVVDLLAGTYGKGTSTFQQKTGLNYTLANGLYINGAVFNQQVNGLNATVDTIRTPGVFKTADKDGFRKTDALIKAGYRHGRWDVFASYKDVDQRADIDNSVYTDDDNAYLDFNRDILAYNATYELTKHWKVTALGSWSNSVRKNMNDSSKVSADGQYDGTVVTGKYNGRILTHELQANYDYKTLKGVIGFGRYSEDMWFNTYFFSNAWGTSIVNYDSIDSSAKTHYAFGQLRYDIQRFNITAGTRFSNHELFGSVWTMEANPSYRFTNMLVYASLSTGFNAPSLYQLYDPSRVFGAYTTRGNKKLKPEESRSLELGIKKEFTNGSFLTLSAFRTRVDNSIEYVYLWNKETAMDELTGGDHLGDTYLNISKQVTTGIEVSGHVVIDKFFVNANFTWLDGELDFDPHDLEEEHTGGHHVQLYNFGSFITTTIQQDKLIRRPGMMAYGEIGYRPIQNVTVNAVYRFADSRYDVGYSPDLGPYGALGLTNVRAYHLVDLGANWRLTRNIQLGVKVENVLDEAYHEIVGFQTRGRSGYVKVLVQW